MIVGRSPQSGDDPKVSGCNVQRPIQRARDASQARGDGLEAMGRSPVATGLKLRV